MIERIRFYLQQPMERAGALPVGSYALPNNLPVGCLHHWLHNGVCGEGSTGPFLYRDGVDRAPKNPFWPVISQPTGPGLPAWTLAARLDCRVLSLDSATATL
jgi:hypothetical protein